jgi:hypothetical protein
MFMREARSRKLEANYSISTIEPVAQRPLQSWSPARFGLWFCPKRMGVKWDSVHGSIDPMIRPVGHRSENWEPRMAWVKKKNARKSASKKKKMRLFIGESVLRVNKRQRNFLRFQHSAIYFTYT